jgi:DNA recombination protein RmuC
MDPGIPVATTLSLLAVLLVGVLLGLAAGVLWGRSRGDGRVLERAEAESRAGEAAVLRESLDRLHDQLRDMAQHEVSWQSQLKQQVEDVRHGTETLRRETASLSTALRRPQVRGRWGELHLRRVVELAGLVDRCDFDEQVSTRTDDQLRRPDLVVRLAGGRHLVVDAKVPLDAF